MPYDDRSNYEKGSTEELGQWYTTTLRKRQLRGEASLSLIEDPRPRLQAHFFQSSSVTRIVATQHNKTQLGCRRLQPLASHYFKLHIVLHRLQSAETVFVAGSHKVERGA